MPLFNPLPDVGLLPNGTPFFVSSNRKITGSGTGAASSADYEALIYSIYEKKFMAVIDDTTINDKLVSFDDANAKPVLYTNEPLIGGIILSGKPRLNFTDNIGSLLLTGSGVMNKGSSLDPKTCIFSAITPIPLGLATGLFSIAGQICALRSNLSIYVSTDDGITWGPEIFGFGDVDHGGDVPTVSPDGSTVVLSNINDTFITRDVASGIGAVIGTIPLGFIPGPREFNTDGTVLIFSGAQNGRLHFTTSANYNGFTQISAANNPFVSNDVDAGTSIQNVTYSSFHKGFFVQGSTICGFISDDDLTTVRQGVWTDFNFFPSIGGLASDNDGGVLGVGLNNNVLVNV